MRRIFFILIIITTLLFCSKDDTGALINNFPVSYQFDSLQILGTSTYHFTDTIIYKTGNNLVENLNLRGQRIVDSIFYGNQPQTSEFLIEEIVFNSPEMATVSLTSGTDTGPYDEVAGIGQINNNLQLAFKINPDQQSLISCLTITSKRNIDTLYEEAFNPSLDTLYTADSTLAFQLIITEGKEIDIRFCNPFGESNLVTEFANNNMLQNDDRIMTHRTDLIFTRKD